MSLFKHFHDAHLSAATKPHIARHHLAENSFFGQWRHKTTHDQLVTPAFPSAASQENCLGTTSEEWLHHTRPHPAATLSFNRRAAPIHCSSFLFAKFIPSLPSRLSILNPEPERGFVRPALRDGKGAPDAVKVPERGSQPSGVTLPPQTPSSVHPRSGQCAAPGVGNVSTLPSFVFSGFAHMNGAMCLATCLSSRVDCTGRISIENRPIHQTEANPPANAIS